MLLFLSSLQSCVVTFFAAAWSAGCVSPPWHPAGPLTVQRAEHCWQMASRSKGVSIAPKISGLCHFGPRGPNSDPYRVILKLLQQCSLLAQFFLAFSRWMELLHQDVTCGPPREPQWKKARLAHRCFLSSSTAHTSPNHVLNHGRVLPEDRGDIQEQPSSENPLTHA